MSNRTATVSEVARFLDVPAYFVYNAVRDGFFLSVKDVDGKIYLSLAECSWAYSEFLKKLQNSPTTAPRKVAKVRKEVMAMRDDMIENRAELVSEPSSGIVCPTCRVDLLFVAGAVLVLALFGAVVYIGFFTPFS